MLFVLYVFNCHISGFSSEFCETDINDYEKTYKNPFSVCLIHCLSHSLSHTDTHRHTHTLWTSCANFKRCFDQKSGTQLSWILFFWGVLCLFTTLSSVGLWTSDPLSCVGLMFVLLLYFKALPYASHLLLLEVHEGSKSCQKAKMERFLVDKSQKARFNR